MDNKLVNYFLSFASLTVEEQTAIADSMCTRTFDKGTVLLREGQVSKECYFVMEGCVRQYSVVDGEEKTSQFFTEEQWVVSLHSFMEQVPANHYLICAEATTLVVGNAAKEEELLRRFPKFEQIARMVMEKNFAQQQEQMTAYLTDSPEQRYEKLLHSRPDLFQRIPQYQLASYIGVQPESLSRIRKRIAQKNKSVTVSD